MRILDLTSAVQKYLGIFMVVVPTFPVYRNERFCQTLHLYLMNTVEDILAVAVEYYVHRNLSKAQMFAFRERVIGRLQNMFT